MLKFFEILVIAVLLHNGIVGFIGGTHFITMKFITGTVTSASVQQMSYWLIIGLQCPRPSVLLSG